MRVIMRGLLGRVAEGCGIRMARECGDGLQ